MSKEIQHYLAHLYPLLATRGIEIYQQKEIAYGVQLKLSRGEDKANLNIYFGKKGLSTVLSGSESSLLKPELEALLLGIYQAPEGPNLHTWHSWIGSDECGKGDYFGPLVLAAFYLKKEQEKELLELGVTDSKKLSDGRIKILAKAIYQRFPGQSNSLLIKNRRYNEMIADFKLQKLNLNDLLAWAHFKVIQELIKPEASPEGILIDQFSLRQKAKSRLIQKYPELNVIERTSAERDPAVAAASILARFQYLQSMDELRKRYGFSFPLGAGPGVIKAAKDFVNQHGEKALGEVAKIHFKTTARVLNR